MSPRGVFNNTSTVTTGVTPGKRVPSLTVLVHFYPHLTGDARFSRLTHASDICNPSLGVVLHVYPCLATLGLLVLLSLVISSLFNKRFSAFKHAVIQWKIGYAISYSFNERDSECCNVKIWNGPASTARTNVTLQAMKRLQPSTVYMPGEAHPSGKIWY